MGKNEDPFGHVSTTYTGPLSNGENHLSLENDENHLSLENDENPKGKVLDILKDELPNKKEFMQEYTQNFLNKIEQGKADDLRKLVGGGAIYAYGSMLINSTIDKETKINALA
ncbi:hypothetical protein LR004_03370, partial [Candidatus Gracilibacteria bacterium]|nr:hypothetical protein [Candidatus Gracilibacteria bacterium]